MPLKTAQSIKKQYERLKSDRSTWESIWQEVADYGLARRTTFTQEATKQGSGKQTQSVYDNTMMVSNDMLASGLHNLLTSPSLRWFHLEPENLALLEDQEAVDWFAQNEEIMATEISRPGAGFHPEIHEVYNDVAAFGNAALSIIRAPGEGLFFQAMPLTETVVDVGADGTINTVFRCFKWTSMQFRERFGEGVSKRMDEMWKADKLDHDIKLLQCIMPNELYKGSKRFGVQSKRWKSMVLDLDGVKILEETYFNENPIVFARWNKDPGEIYARGPGVQALSEARMLNEMAKTTIQAAQKAVSPPLLVPDNGIVTQLDMSPDGLTVYRAGTQDPVRELYTRTGQNPDLGVELIQNIQTKVRAAYHFELLQIMQDPRMSATQVLELSGRAQQILGPLMGRLQTELLEPVLERCFSILERMGRITPPPSSVAGQPIRVRFVSPVQRSQRATEAQSLLNAMNTVLQMAQAEPTVMDKLDPDRHAEFLYDAWGVPPELLRTQEFVDQMRQARAQQQQQQEQQQQAAQIAESVGKAAPALQLLQGGDTGAQ